MPAHLRIVVFCTKKFVKGDGTVTMTCILLSTFPRVKHKIEGTARISGIESV